MMDERDAGPRRQRETKAMGHDMITSNAANYTDPCIFQL